MPRFLDTRSQPTLGIGICARCSFKFPLAELFSDPNAPGLKVCKRDLDVLDPYRLPPPQPDQFNLPFTRPDVPIINPWGDVPPWPVPQSYPAFPPPVPPPPPPDNVLTTASGVPITTASGVEILV